MELKLEIGWLNSMQNILAIINGVILKGDIRANSSYLRNEKQLYINIAPTSVFL